MNGVTPEPGPEHIVSAKYSAGSCVRSAFVWIEGRPSFAPFGPLGKLYATGPDEPAELFVTPVTWFCRAGLALPLVFLAGLLWDGRLAAMSVFCLALWAGAYVLWAKSTARGRPTATVVLNDA